MSTPLRLSEGTPAACADVVDAFLHAQGLSPADATVSVWVTGVGSEETAGPPEAVLSLAADEQHYAASTMKLPLLLAAYRLAERGDLDLDAEVPVRELCRSAEPDAPPYSILQVDDQDDETWDRVGGTASLRFLAEHATVHSGNLATNLLLDHVGLGEVASVLEDAGCSPGTVVARGIGDAAAREAGRDNLVTAEDLGRVLHGIAARTLAAPATCAAVEDVLARQQWRDGIPAGLPAGTYVANKTGWVEGVAHDVALVRPSGAGPYVLVACVTAAAGEDALDRLLADLSRAVWEGRLS